MTITSTKATAVNNSRTSTRIKITRADSLPTETSASQKSTTTKRGRKPRSPPPPMRTAMRVVKKKVPPPTTCPAEGCLWSSVSTDRQRAVLRYVL